MNIYIDFGVAAASFIFFIVGTVVGSMVERHI